MGNRDEAMKAAQSAIALANNPTTPQDVMELAESYDRLADLHRINNELRLAADTSDEAIELFDSLKLEELSVHERVTYAQSLRRRGAIHEQSSEMAEAERLLTKGLTMLEDALGMDAGMEVCRQPLAETLNSLAIVYRATGQTVDAERCYRRSISLSEALVAENTADADARYQLAISYTNLANLLLVQKRWDESLESNSKSQEAFALLVENYPFATLYQERMAGGLIQRGYALQATDRPDLAEATYRRAIQLCGQVEESIGRTESVSDTLALCWNNLGNILEKRGQRDESIESYKQAIEIRSQASMESDKNKFLTCQGHR